jgi:inosine-uridine nucleoside N-ribohydrolase
MIDIISKSNEQITLISIAPLGNIANALERMPQIAFKTRFVGMQGSIRKGYEGSDTIDAEYNVSADANSCQKVFTAPWEITITPVDTCGILVLKGEKYQKVLNCRKPLVEALMDNYRFWWGSNRHAAAYPEKYLTESSLLFDTVAIYLAFSENLLVMEELGVKVTDDGFTLVDENAKKLRCATSWKDMEAFEDLLLQRLLSWNAG